MKALKPSRRVFTLIEMLVVVAIISILAAMLAPTLQKALDSARAVICANNLRQVGMALTMYGNDWNGAFPNVVITAVKYAAGPSSPAWANDNTPECHTRNWPYLLAQGGHLPINNAASYLAMCCPVAPQIADLESVSNNGGDWNGWGNRFAAKTGLTAISWLPNGLTCGRDDGERVKHPYVGYRNFKIPSPGRFMGMVDRNAVGDGNSKVASFSRVLGVDCADFGPLDMEGAERYHRWRDDNLGWWPDHPTWSGINGWHAGGQKLNMWFYDNHVGSHGYLEGAYKGFYSVKK